MGLVKNMKKDALVTLLLAVILVVGVTILNKKETKKEKSYFFVETPILKYSPTMSSVKGFPFTIKCNNGQIVTIEITNGTLQDEKEILKENKVSCNKTVYWNEEEIVNEIKIKFYSNEPSLKKQEFTLYKNDEQEFYLSE